MIQGCNIKIAIKKNWPEVFKKIICIRYYIVQKKKKMIGHIISL